MALKNGGFSYQLLGCIIGSIAIFLPSALLVLFFFPVWQYFKKFVVVYRALEGINAVVVGLMAAAVAYLLHGMQFSVSQFTDLLVLLVISGTFFLLKYTKVPPPVIVVFCVVLGWVF